MGLRSFLKASPVMSVWNGPRTSGAIRAGFVPLVLVLFWRQTNSTPNRTEEIFPCAGAHTHSTKCLNDALDDL
jgi:hypothetical protein